MAYFVHAFQKMLIGTAGFVTSDGAKSHQLAPGEIGIIDSKTNQSIAVGGTPSYATTPLVYLAQGSFRTSDKVGPYHGGYQESVKSKGINPKYVSRFYLVEPKEPSKSVISITSDDCTVLCDTTMYLRLDVKGSPALRFMNHNIYHTFDAKTPCCADPENPTAEDPMHILIGWMEQINSEPLINQFVRAGVFGSAGGIVTVTGAKGSDVITVPDADRPFLQVGSYIEGAGTIKLLGGTGSGGPGLTSVTLNSPLSADAAGVNSAVLVVIDPDTYVFKESGAPSETGTYTLLIEGAYVDTKFGNCSFDPNDHFETEPVQLYASITDISGDPCRTECFVVEVISNGVSGNGYGETVLRELILFKRYLQEPFDTDPRMREILGDTSLDTIERDEKYFVYHILHSIPRANNPSGTFDADQYLIKIVTNNRSSDFENFFQEFFESANNPITLEVF